MKKKMYFITKDGLIEVGKSNLTATALHIAKVNLTDFLDGKTKNIAKPKGKIKGWDSEDVL